MKAAETSDMAKSHSIMHKLASSKCMETYLLHIRLLLEQPLHAAYAPTTLHAWQRTDSLSRPTAQEAECGASKASQRTANIEEEHFLSRAGVMSLGCCQSSGNAAGTTPAATKAAVPAGPSAS